MLFHAKPQSEEQPDGYDAPTELVLAWHMGDNRMLRSGGLLDQPALHFKANYANYVWELLKELSKKDFQISSLADDASKMAMVLKLQEMKERLRREGRL